MPIARNGDVELFYEVTGAGEPLVLIMGLGADHSVWELHRQAYETHFRCIAIDNRGVGRSGKPAGPYSTAEMARDVLAVMDHAGVERVHIAGISMGGAIAQEVCLQNPARVRSLILVATWARLPAFNANVFQHFKAVRAHTAPSDFVRCLQLWIWSGRTFETDAAGLQLARDDAGRDPAPQPQFAFEAQCDACIGHDTHARIGAIAVPTLITAGDEDIFTPPAQARELHDGIRGSTLLTLPGCAHTHHWEALDRFNQTTLRFLLDQ